jgi:hypothetical protein
MGVWNDNNVTLHGFAATTLVRVPTGTTVIACDCLACTVETFSGLRGPIGKVAIGHIGKRRESTVRKDLIPHFFSSADLGEQNVGDFLAISCGSPVERRGEATFLLVLFIHFFRICVDARNGARKQFHEFRLFVVDYGQFIVDAFHGSIKRCLALSHFLR